MMFSRYYSKIGALLVGAALSFKGYAQINQNTDRYFEISKNIDLFTNIFKELNMLYVDPIEPGKMTKTGVDAMLKELDPFTNFLTETDAEVYELQIGHQYGNLGIQLKINRKKQVVIRHISSGSPLIAEGIVVGMVINAINGSPVLDKNLEDIDLMMRGAEHTNIELSLEHPLTKAAKNVKVKRGTNTVSANPSGRLIGAQKKIAYVTFPQFTPHCSRKLKQKLDSLKKEAGSLQGVVVDMRNNPGGLMNEAVNICNLFIDRGTVIVSTKGKNKEWNKSFPTEQDVWDANIPVVALINHQSASASEIVAGTLQDLDRGTVIGTRSYGKGLVQVIRPIGYNNRLKVTTAKYYTPSGRCIQAIDYSHKNADGSVSTVPDSMRKEFKTVKGRKVFDGGGVEPDIKIEDAPMNSFVFQLVDNDLLFDYVTYYQSKHAQIASPESFQFTSNDYQDFKTWLNQQGFNYQSGTKKLLDELTATAEKEYYLKDIQAEINAIKNKTTHNVNQALQIHQKEITELLQQEIIGRYYYEEGKTLYALSKQDQYIQKALNVLQP